MALLAVIFAGAALVLVGVGLYGVLAHLVAQKALEISLRKALGATSGRIVREVTTPAFLILLAAVRMIEIGTYVWQVTDLKRCIEPRLIDGWRIRSADR